MKISVEKITGLNLLQRANRFTTGRESKMTLAKAYKHGHTPIRTQLFWVEATDIPLYVASQLVRSHVGVQFFQLSKRTDRGGKDFREVCESLSETARTIFEYGQPMADALAFDIWQLAQHFDRYTPTDLAFIINAEALINMAHKRLCAKASKDTRQLMLLLRQEIKNVDPELFEHLVPICTYRGGICTEPKSCGYAESSWVHCEFYKQMLRNS